MRYAGEQNLLCGVTAIAHLRRGTLDIKYRVSEAVRLIVTKGKSYGKEGIKVQADMLSTMTEGLGEGL